MLIAHFESQQLLPWRQSAYRARRSTETAIIAVHDEIVKAIDAGEVCALVLLHLSAALTPWTTRHFYVCFAVVSE